MAQFRSVYIHPSSVDDTNVRLSYRVRISLQFATLLRLPQSMPHRLKLQRLENIVDALELHKCLNTSERRSWTVCCISAIHYFNHFLFRIIHPKKYQVRIVHLSWPRSLVYLSRRRNNSAGCQGRGWAAVLILSSFVIRASRGLATNSHLDTGILWLSLGLNLVTVHLGVNWRVELWEDAG